MPEVTQYEPGTPCWTDLATPDLDRSIAFYGALFGWEAARGPDEVGGYTMFLQGGRHVGGAGPLFNEGQPAAWATYVSVEDADGTAEMVAAGGGTVVAPPMDVLDVGRTAAFLDTEGAAFSVWQPRARRGAELVDEPVSLSWNELNTLDWDAAERFYGPLFGWTFDRVSPDGPTRYAEISLGDHPEASRLIGGVLPMDPRAPAIRPPHWLAYFCVAGVDATVERATELGGSVLQPPMNIPQGRLAVLSGPDGEVFAVNTLAEASP